MKKEGDRVPEVTFRLRENNDWVNRSTQDIFSGKKVIVFSLPGAFTPTCSSSHLPRYNQLASMFKKEAGVDEIVCMSVNDAFVMNAWARDLEAENVTLIGDGNGEFTEAMGQLVAKDDLGFGRRSWRYSMFVDDGVIKKMFIEPDKPGDPFEVSDADTMLKYLKPDAKAPEAVALFTKPGCPHCASAKKLLEEKGLDYEEVVLGKDATTAGMIAVTGRTSTPQVFIGGKLIGSNEELHKHFGESNIR